MQLTGSDPDIATLVRKIEQNRLDLQPNFQRGEVWSKQKKQKLIDSIIRGWHIPPIHVIQAPLSEKQEVLDGQQRLAAIRDFIKNEFPINGSQDPKDAEVSSLDDMYWKDLPSNIQSRIEDFTIRVLTVSNYKPGEPGELFYRLNQPTNLTSAEQRNAFFGEARQQVKDLAEWMADSGFTTETIGFSNSRMAYDDVLAKTFLALENKSLNKKVTAGSVTTRYRDATGFSARHLEYVKGALSEIIGSALSRVEKTKLNKATLFSWIVFICRARRDGIDGSIEAYMDWFESFKDKYSSKSTVLVPRGLTTEFLNVCIGIYQDRASSRVSDTSSVILRDIILFGLYLCYTDCGDDIAQYSDVKRYFHYISSRADLDEVERNLTKLSQKVAWGDIEL
ncbi:DUF262 domain-containing protein [Pseudomonas sp. CAM1A]|uniref:DUF262 domain-containing protein n=1 Tax=Pseudomonas sp. CAM1A TaxID=3231717 RepID=UPI0039C716F6